MAKKEMTFATSGFERYAKKTRRAQCKIVERHYPVEGGVGRPPIGVERMLRMYFLQHWFNLSDPAVEEALYESNSMRAFVGIDLGRERVPDETTVCKFRHLLEEHSLGKRIFRAVKSHLARSGLTVGPGTIVDATIIHAPSSTKNKDGKRDPEMHSTRKGNQWFFGMKAHIGVDSKTGLVHSLITTSANVHASQALPDLLHGNETRIWGDSAYMGQKAAIDKRAPNAKDFTNKRARRNCPLTKDETEANRTKSRVRAKVEHPFCVVKRLWGFTKVRYRGLAKNANRLYVAFALSNLFVSRNKLLRLQGA